MGHAKAHHGSAGGGRRAFTIIELIVSIAIIALLIGIAVFGVHALGTAARGTVAQTMVNQIATGAEKFDESVGFPPPLVKDQGNPKPAVTTLTYVRGARNAINVYEPDVDADIRVMHTLPPAASIASIDNNPFQDDYRYSESTLAFYLVGALDSRYVDTSAPNVVIDGVKGPGLFKPNHDGEFGVPRELVQSDGTKHVGTPMESFVNVSSGGAKLAYPTQNEPRSVVLVDGAGVPIRYYMWLNGTETPPNSNKYVMNGLADLKVPRMVGRFTVDVSSPLPDQTNFPTPPDRDIRQNPALRNAKWAIVAAGPNGVFGDETDLQKLAQRLGRSYDPSQEAKIRAEAEKDNIVRVDDGK